MMQELSGPHSEIESSWQKYNGHKSRSMPIMLGRRLGEGGFGNAHEVTLRVGNHSRRFVLKQFFGLRAKKNAIQALNNYRQIKNNGLRVFTTYRLDKNETSILMTDPRTEKGFCLGTNAGSSSLRDFGQGLIKFPEQLPNFKIMVQQFFANVERASATGIAVDPDSVFFILNQVNNVKKRMFLGLMAKDIPIYTVDFVFGDVDNIMPAQLNPAVLALMNLQSARLIMQCFFSKNLSAQPRRVLYPIINAEFQKRIATVREAESTFREEYKRVLTGGKISQ